MSKWRSAGFVFNKKTNDNGYKYQTIIRCDVCEDGEITVSAWRTQTGPRGGLYTTPVGVPFSLMQRAVERAKEIAGAPGEVVEEWDIQT